MSIFLKYSLAEGGGLTQAMQIMKKKYGKDLLITDEEMKQQWANTEKRILEEFDDLDDDDFNLSDFEDTR